MITIKEERNLIYDVYYHATFKKYLPSIKKYGLGARHNKNWNISNEGKIYWTFDPNVAESFCEAAEDVSDEVYDSGIVILSIYAKDLTGVEQDTNLQDYYKDEFITSKGVIPFSKLSIYEPMN